MDVERGELVPGVGCIAVGVRIAGQPVTDSISVGVPLPRLTDDHAEDVAACVLRATEELFSYVEREERQIRDAERVLKGAHRFNHRQRAVLSHALRHPADEHTIQAHQRAHGVVYQTARQDLLDLARSGYLKKVKRGHAFVFGAAPRLSAALKRSRA